MQKGARPAVMEIRAVDDAGTFEGYLSRFNEVDAYGDVMMPGCFTKTLKEKGTRRPMLWQHQSWEPIGVIDCKQDDVGLQITGRLNLDVQRGREALALIKQGSVRGLSQGFVVVDYEPRREGGGRNVKEVDLWEGSPVTFPALPSAQIIAARHLLPPSLAGDDAGDERSMEARLLLRSLAQQLAAHPLPASE
jgi:HK97 family phage prohead protease